MKIPAARFKFFLLCDLLASLAPCPKLGLGAESCLTSHSKQSPKPPPSLAPAWGLHCKFIEWVAPHHRPSQAASEAEAPPSRTSFAVRGWLQEAAAMGVTCSKPVIGARECAMTQAWGPGPGPHLGPILLRHPASGSGSLSSSGLRAWSKRPPSSQRPGDRQRGRGQGPPEQSGWVAHTRATGEVPCLSWPGCHQLLLQKDPCQGLAKEKKNGKKKIHILYTANDNNKKRDKTPHAKAKITIKMLTSSIST